MKDYYQDKVRTSEKQLELAKTGFSESVLELGHKLIATPQYEAAKPIVEELNELLFAMSDLEENVEYNKKKLQEEWKQ